MEIQFSRGGQPDGGKISNFLLEKVCVMTYKHSVHMYVHSTCCLVVYLIHVRTCTCTCICTYSTLYMLNVYRSPYRICTCKSFSFCIMCMRNC